MRDDAFSTRAQKARATAGFTAQADALAKRCKSGVLKLFTQWSARHSGTTVGTGIQSLCD